MKPAIYSSQVSKQLALDSLIEIFRSLNVDRVVFKRLSPNDNSKNQPYLAGHFTDLGFLPTGELVASTSTSQKTNDPKRKVKFTAALDFHWVSPDGKRYVAPNAKLIYYPQFPEVRLSGFLAGSEFDMDGWMDPAKKGRYEGRVLILGIRSDGKIFAFLATPDARISKELETAVGYSISSVLWELQYTKRKQLSEEGNLFLRESAGKYNLSGNDDKTAKIILLSELKRIHLLGQIESKKLDGKGNAVQYRARNGGGYTLEAELGVIPNGIAEPDFHGWEVKQFGVENFSRIESKVLTLMTPEPNGGIYAQEGVKVFIQKYGYSNQKILDRFDFTGRHFWGKFCEKSGLKLVTPGFDAATEKLIDATGYLGLLDSSDNVAASWSFIKLLEHWKEKHARAVYVPSISNDRKGLRYYQYGNEVRLFQGTDINRMLASVVNEKIYYDPGIKLENASTKPKIKKRSQFRIKSKDLPRLYEELETIDLLDR